MVRLRAFQLTIAVTVNGLVLVNDSNADLANSGYVDFIRAQKTVDRTTDPIRLGQRQFTRIRIDFRLDAVVVTPGPLQSITLKLMMETMTLVQNHLKIRFGIAFAIHVIWDLISVRVYLLCGAAIVDELLNALRNLRWVDISTVTRNMFVVTRPITLSAFSSE
jgi:hypothetical protein